MLKPNTFGTGKNCHWTGSARLPDHDAGKEIRPSPSVAAAGR
jgi:hypothetical protein